MDRDSCKLKGYYKLELFDPEGILKHEVEGQNLIVTAGKTLVADILNGDSSAIFSHCAVGTSNQAAAAGDTALIGTELSREAFLTKLNTANAIEFVTVFGAGSGTGTIEEAGILNAVSGGTLFSRFLTGTFVKGANDLLVVTYTLTVG